MHPVGRLQGTTARAFPWLRVRTELLPRLSALDTALATLRLARLTATGRLHQLALTPLAAVARNS